MDTEVRIQDVVLAAHGLRKGYMSLVSAEEQEFLFAGLQDYPTNRAAGGSAANTMVGVARFGGSAFYAGKVGNDMTGALYRESLAEAGVDFDVAAHDGAPTGTCLVLVSPDGERTMQTHLGASSGLRAADINSERIHQSAMVYVEGYLWGSAGTRAAAERAMETARSADVRVALSLSDPSMVEAFGDDLRRATKTLVHTVFCNEHEGRLYAGVRGSREDVLRALARDCAQVFMTAGADGSLAYARGRVTPIAPHRVAVVDTTGAGDVYAAGVLHGLTHGMSVADAGRLGSFASALIVTTMGPRLKRSLADHVPAILAGASPADVAR